MRLTTETITRLAKHMVERLIERGVAEITTSVSEVEAAIRRVITTELRREQEQTVQVRTILQSHARQMNKEGADYQRMFQMVKRKLAKERGIVI